MRRTCGLVVLLAGLLAAQGVAAPALAYLSASTLTLSLTPQASIPIQLAAGPQGSTTISVNKTGAASTILKPNTWNTTQVNNTGATAYRVRLTQVSVTNVGSCKQCDLEFRRTGGTTSSQVRIRNGSLSDPASQAQGAWLTFNATGSAGSAWYLYGILAQFSKTDPTAVLSYNLEYVATTSSSPSVVYWNMTMNFTPG